MTKGRVCLIISAVLYGILPVLTAISYRGGINGITLTFLRSAISLPVLYLIIRVDKRKLRLTHKQFKKVVVLGLFGGTMPILFLYLSYHYIATGLASTLHFIYPLLIVISSAVIYHEKLSRVTLSSVMFVTVGIFMFADITKTSDITGIVLAILSGVFYSFYVVYIDRSGLDRMDYVVLTFYIMVIMSVSMLIFGLSMHALYFDFSPVSWSFSAVISLIVTLGAMPLFQIGVRYEGAQEAGILSTIEPVISVVLGSLVLGEFVGPGQIMGGAMILLGVLMAQKKPAQAALTEGTNH